MSERIQSLTLPPPARLLADQVVYHARVLLRTPRAVVGGILLPILLLLLRTGTTHATHLEQVKLVAGLVAFGALSTAYITHTASLVAARQHGVLKRWRATPLPAWCYFAGRILATALLAAVGGLLTALVGTVHDHIFLSLGGITELLAGLLLGGATWACIGTAASALIPTTEAAWPLLGLTYLPLVFLSGSFGSIGGQPGWLSTVLDYLPARPIIDTATRALQTGGGSLHDLAVLGAWAAAATLLSLRYFRWIPGDAGRRRR
jgi:ABC-2 type transport system permease protein